MNRHSAIIRAGRNLVTEPAACPGAGFACRRGLRRLSALVLILLLLFQPVAVVAGDLGPVFRMTGVADGLPDSRVEAVIQDAHGYIWIGTRSGLVRHEGNRLNVLGSDLGAADPLPGRNIMTLHGHSDGTVWASVAGHGMVQIGPDLHRKRHLKLVDQGGILPHDNIWDIAEDCQGRLWLAYMQGGVGRYDPDSNDYRHYPQDEAAGLYPSGFQLGLAVDSNCRIWLAQSEQLGLFDVGEDRFKKIVERGSGGLIVQVVEARGEIYFTQRDRLYTLGPLETAAKSRPKEIMTARRVLTGIAEEPGTGRLFVTGYEGLFRLHPESRNVEHIRAISGLDDGLPNSNLIGVLFDDEGGAWITVARHGVAYMPPGHGAFQRHQFIPGSDSGLKSKVVNAVTTLPPDRRELWLGTVEQGIEVLDLDTGESVWLRERYDSDNLVGFNPFTDFLIDEQQAFIVQHRTVSALDQESGEVDVLLNRDQIDDGTFSFVQADGPDHLWVATLDTGLLRYNLGTRDLEHFGPRETGRQHFPETGPVMVERGPDGAWWTVASRGVYRFDEHDGFRQVIEPERPPLLSSTWDGEDLWLASEVSLERWRWEGTGLQRVESFALPGNLPPGRIHRIFPVENSGIWLVRSSGLARLDPDRGQFRSYTRDDGLAASEFFPRSSVQLDDGRLALGGSGGLVLVDPWQVGGAQVPPPVHIKALHAGDEQFRLAPDERPTIELEHHNNSFLVDFAALSYVSFDQNRYRVMLEGWDDSWLEFVGQNRHHYSNLPPGQYRFRVQASTADGAWNEEGDTLMVTIQNPPWLSPWAVAAYAILGATGAGAGWRGFQVTRRRRREMREARQKRALAEAQRQVVERLNRSLEPLELAGTIATEILSLTGGARACIGFQHDQLPRELVSTDGEAFVPTREQWRAGLERADGDAELAVSLGAEDEILARVLVEAGPDGFSGDYRQRLALLVQMASQALYNSLLLERVRALAVRAEEANSAKSEFLATMSHEIRTPLHGVLGMVELLYESETEPSQQDILGTLRHSGQQLQRIIDDVLDISRIEAGRMSLNEQPFELVAMLEQVIDLHAPNAARKGLDLRLRIAAGLPLMAMGDADRISQVLGNLLSNAVKFTEKGGIELSAEVGRDGQLVMVVSDSGPGIDAADRERLFEPFTQLDASITRTHSGSGLGLAICRRLVDAMDGQLTLLEACHSGSRFVVRLPVLERPTPAAPPTMTRMLDDVSVAAVLDAPDFRIARRLARRWNIQLVDAVDCPPSPATLLLVDPLSVGEREAADLQAWVRKAEATAWLQSPYNPNGAGGQVAPEGAHFLRWPLVESRLIGLLLDLAIARQAPDD